MKNVKITPPLTKPIKNRPCRFRLTKEEKRILAACKVRVKMKNIVKHTQLIGKKIVKIERDEEKELVKIVLENGHVLTPYVANLEAEEFGACIRVNQLPTDIYGSERFN